MKILGSYKKMMNELINDAKITAKRDKVSDRPGEKAPYKTPGGSWAGKHKGEIEYFDSEEQAKDYIQHGHAADNEPGGATPDEPEPGKLSGKGDFERGGDEPEAEPQSEPKDDKPKDYAGSIEDDDAAGQLANDIAQGADPDEARKELADMGHGDLADAIKFADSDEEKARIIAKASGNEFYEETININGKQYKPIRESKKHILKENYERFFGEK